jgi:hypothetical protein
MKPQDVIFLIVFLVVIFKRSYKLAVGLGLFCLLLAIPLFAKWIFFTAERLTYYAWAFIALGVILLFIRGIKEK